MLALFVLAVIQPVSGAPENAPPAAGLAMPPMWAIGLVVVGLLVLGVLSIIARRKRVAVTDQAFQERVKTPRSAPVAGSGEAELARELIASLDARADRLERLMAEADERLARLERASRSIAANSAGTAHSTATIQMPSGSRSVAQEHDITVHVRPISAASTTAARPSPVGTASEGEHADLTGSIYALADEGHTPVQIAQRLRTHVGKVELILALRPERSA